MQRLWNCAVLVLAGLVLAAAPGPARALIIALPPLGPERVAKADIVVVGRIVSLEDKDVTALPFAKAPKQVTYRIAVLKVAEGFKGAKEGQTLRLAFIPAPDPKA